MREMCPMTHCTVDNELCFLHSRSGAAPYVKDSSGVTRDAKHILIAIIAKHVDDS